jgi:hypothetical protein
MILAKDQKKPVLLVSAATVGGLPGFVGAAVVGFGVGSTGPCGMFGVRQVATLHPSAGLIPHRHADEPATGKITK